VRLSVGAPEAAGAIATGSFFIRQCITVIHNKTDRMTTSYYKTEMEFFVDMQRCIGCKACEAACAECETNGQQSMIHVNYVERAVTIQTTVQVCMHCDDPVCANVCPADAISKDEFGVVHTANSARCIGCSNCVMACPFGVPIKEEKYDMMMKCNMCYDRTSAGKKPMCATVCPSQALYYGTREEMRSMRPNSVPVNTFQFGKLEVKTKVNIMMPAGSTMLKVD
jgi:Fe-S-cluster-containing dehydrogenase component